MNTTTAAVLGKLYVHDHLFSPVALVQMYHLDVKERYEYDAYGNCQIMDASYNPRSSSSYSNPYYFTGRQLDFLDGGNLKIQYNRNRYYDYYTGRWLTHDPISYIVGMNLYEYVSSSPTLYSDPMGLMKVDTKQIREIVKKYGLTEEGKDEIHAILRKIKPKGSHVPYSILDDTGAAVKEMGGKYVLPGLSAVGIIGTVMCMDSPCYAPELRRFAICECESYRIDTTWTVKVWTVMGVPVFGAVGSVGKRSHALGKELVEPQRNPSDCDAKSGIVDIDVDWSPDLLGVNGTVSNNVVPVPIESMPPVFGGGEHNITLSIHYRKCGVIGCMTTCTSGDILDIEFF